MLFHPKNKKRLQTIWMVLGILVAVSMILLYIPVLFQ